MGAINDRFSLIVEHSGLSKTAFSKKLNVTQQYVSKLQKEGTPSDRTISDICQKFNVNEAWLRTGDGEMFIPTTRSQEIADFVGSILKGEEDNFKRRFVAMLARLDESEWEFIEQKALELFEEKKKD